MDGFIIVNKPAGITSFGVCACLRRISGEKAGHAGTLDPMAEGVLVAALGKATRLIGYTPDSEKEYIAGIRFGLCTDTLDIWGKVLSESEPQVTHAMLTEAAAAYTGSITQVTPAYSAARVAGQHLYEYARSGREVALPERRVNIGEIEITAEDLPREATLRVKCSRGTYIRSLCDDIGAYVGCGAVMSSLLRTYACGFSLAEATALDELGSAEDIAAHLLSCDAVLGYLPRADVMPSACAGLKNGAFVSAADCVNISRGISAGEKLRLYADGTFAALATALAEGFKPDKLFI